jgi:hypothetical protein
MYRPVELQGARQMLLRGTKSPVITILSISALVALAATPDMYLDGRGVVTDGSRVGCLAAGVPGSVVQ